MGLDAKNWGWACEYISHMDVVTADGRQLRCSETENEDLFWAARGAGPGFPAIVTRFYLRTRPMPSGMHISLFQYPLSEYAAVLQWVIDVCHHYFCFSSLLHSRLRHGPSIRSNCWAPRKIPVVGAPESDWR